MRRALSLGTPIGPIGRRVVCPASRPLADVADWRIQCDPASRAKSA